MNRRTKLIVAVFLILNCSSAIKSDHIEDNCREVQCPQPELECPIDSKLKSSASDDLEHSDDEDKDSESNPFDRLEAEGLIEDLFPSSIISTTTITPYHILQKRSLQHRRREAIKIVPGDYRSFEPEFFKYHNHHQPHRKWKRDLVMGVQPHSEAEIQKCCPELQCVCGTCPNPPKCENGQVAIVVEHGHGLPGSCCSKYECIPEMECSVISQPKSSYWRSDCLKCDCYHGQELCEQICEINEDQSAMNCFSGYLNRPKMNGDTWLEDKDCKECKCVNGESQCQESVCISLDCKNPLKIEGKCCKVCPETSSTSTTSTTSTTPVTDAPTTSTPRVETSSSSTSTSSTPSTTTIQSSEFDESSRTTLLPPTDNISTHHEIGDLFEEIDIIVVLILASAILIICTIGMGLVYSQRQKKKKLMYSTIPSSESSQSSSITLA